MIAPRCPQCRRSAAEYQGDAGEQRRRAETAEAELAELRQGVTSDRLADIVDGGLEGLTSDSCLDAGEGTDPAKIAVGVSLPNTRIRQRDSLPGESRAELPTGGNVNCADCALPYEAFGLDMTLPDEQWRQIQGADEGILCARCIVARAGQLQGAIAIRARIEFATGLRQGVTSPAKLPPEECCAACGRPWKQGSHDPVFGSCEETSPAKET